MGNKKELIAEKFWGFWVGILDDLEIKNGCILVEGAHDVKILVNLQVPEERIVVMSDKSYESLVSEITRRYQLVYIFTDLDSQGSTKAKRIMSQLCRYGIEVHDLRSMFRGFLSRFGFKSVGKVEELKKFSLLLPQPNKIVLRKIREDLRL